MICFRITGLSAAPFAHLFGRDDAALAMQGAKRYVVDKHPGFPDRVELRDLELGERALLVNYVHQAASTPYRASHAIFVCEGASEPFDRINDVPEVMRRRTLSLRAFDASGMMLDADLAEGKHVESLIERMFADPEVAYIQAHFAQRGCFAASIKRA